MASAAEPETAPVSAEALAGKPLLTAAEPRAPAFIWKNSAPVFQSSGGSFTLKPLVQLIVDGGTTSGSSHETRNITKTDTRVFQIGASGTIGDHLDYRFETDFSQDEPNITWAYVGWHGLIGKTDADVQLGNLKNDRGFEGATAREALPFIEQNYVAGAMGGERGAYGLGAQARLFGKGWHVSFAATGEDIDSSFEGHDSRTVLARAHWNPLLAERKIIHLGGWGYIERWPETRSLVRKTPVAHGLAAAIALKSPLLAHADADRGFGLEAGGVKGPVWLMIETGWRSTQLPGPDAQDRAASASVGWFVTGGKVPYKDRTGVFGRPKVARPLLNGGPGEIELTGRYEQVRFAAPSFRQDGQSVTAGINWYLNDLVRIMCNSTFWRIEPEGVLPQAISDDGYSLALRVQFAL